MADRRQDIIDAAITLFAERGYAAVGMVDIGAACHLSAGALYLSFANKAALLDAVCTEFMRQVDEHLQLQLASLNDAHVRFERRMRSHAEFVVGHRDQLCVLRRDIEHLPRADQARIWGDVNQLMTGWIDDLMVVRPELPREQARVAAFAGLAALQSIATAPSQLAQAELVDLLAATAAAAQLAFPHAH
jgi:AcrR family transcriptional regulator